MPYNLFCKVGDLMITNFEHIIDLLRIKKDLITRLESLLYDGTVEIKENKSGKYLYIRKRIGNRVTSKYIDKYSDILYASMIKITKEAQGIHKRIKSIDNELIKLGYTDEDLSDKVINNVTFAKKNMKANIHYLAMLEGLKTSFQQTANIVDNGIVNGILAEDVQQILNLKFAWEFILDKTLLKAKSDYNVLFYIVKKINEGFFDEYGRIRGVPARIIGSSYKPPIPNEIKIKEDIDRILKLDLEPIDIAIELFLYVMKGYFFVDGNKRTAFLYANHYLLVNGEGLIVVPYSAFVDFKKLMYDYYEDVDTVSIKKFIKEQCWQKK